MTLAPEAPSGELKVFFFRPTKSSMEVKAEWDSGRFPLVHLLPAVGFWQGKCCVLGFNSMFCYMVTIDYV